MVVIPERLYDEPFVKVIYRSSNAVILKKRLNTSFSDRQSYVAKHGLSIVIKGHQRINTLEGRSLILKQGDIGIIRKGLYAVTDMLSSEGIYESINLFFDDRFLEKILKNHSIKADIQIDEDEMSNYFIKAKNSDYFDCWVSSLDEIQNRIANPSSQLYDAKISELIAILISENKSSDFLKKLAGFVRNPPKGLSEFMNQYFDKPLTVADYANLTGRSISTFRREFKLKFGNSPRKWIIKKRLEKAATLLQSGKFSVSEIGLSVGYESTSHFIKEFKKLYGYTPKRKALSGINY